MEYIITYHIIKMHDNKNVLPILLGRLWLRMANVIVDWEGVKPSITYGPKDNRVKVFIGSLGDWIREEVDKYKDDEKFDDTLVGVVQLNSEKSKIDSGSGFLGPSFYHQGDDGEFAHWLRQYSEFICDVMMTFHHQILRDDMSNSRREDYVSLESCDVHTEEEWVQRGLTPWIDEVEISNMSLVHLDGTQARRPCMNAMM